MRPSIDGAIFWIAATAFWTITTNQTIEPAWATVTSNWAIYTMLSALFYSIGKQHKRKEQHTNG